MKKKLLVLIVTLAFLSVAVVGGHALPKGTAVADVIITNERTISVSGTGTVQIAPDIALVNFGISVDNKDASMAMTMLSQKANAVLQSLSKIGVKKEDIQTTNISLYPVYSYDKDTGKQTLEGYRATESFNVKGAINDAGKILSTVSANGVNEINGISFDVSNKDQLKLDAIKLAMKDARAKADASIDGTGYNINSIKTISIEASSPVPIYKSFAGATENIPVEGGTINVQVNVSVVFTFE
jgi:uncharacterized protein YggE